MEEAFRDDPRVLFVSVHEAGRWPRSGAAEDHGIGNLFNFPVPPGMNDSEMELLVQEAIASGKAQISGSFTPQEAQQLVRELNAGALPVPIKLISQSNVGATLGQEAVTKSIVAGLLGLLMVLIFMIVYYRLPGVLASLALIIYAIMSLAVFIFIPVTMTLAGIAGFVISVGMAIDANILIFERMKEEIREGRSILAAIDAGFYRAWSSIRDSNISTLITCIILYYFGSGLIRGFALTLGIGVILSLFTAVYVARMYLHTAFEWKWTNNPFWFGVKKQNMIEKK